jgi:dGTPase
VVVRQYSNTDTERFVPESHSSLRSDFARDRGRLLHSSALRRLVAKTQVLSPTAGLDFARNRLTHSLEVAQIGRELANRLGVDADVVETACLAHDIGHPPFGHNGERALSEWAVDAGGFEGNAQTFRLLVRLEPKVVDQDGVARGLNLTRASLLASMKYPWGAEASETDASGREKFGVYADDREVFEWVRLGRPGRELSLEACIMDFSDDVAYSVHDFEDAVVNGYVDPALLSNPTHRAHVLDTLMAHDAGNERDTLEAAWERLLGVSGWVTHFEPGRQHLAGLKNLTSTLIGRFAESSTVDEETQTLDVPAQTSEEIAVLKGIVSVHVMSHTARQPIYQEQRAQLTSLANVLYDHPSELDPIFVADWDVAQNASERARVVVDQVASLTDQSAVAMFERLCT